MACTHSLYVPGPKRPARLSRQLVVPRALKSYASAQLSGRPKRPFACRKRQRPPLTRAIEMSTRTTFPRPCGPQPRSRELPRRSIRRAALTFFERKRDRGATRSRQREEDPLAAAPDCAAVRQPPVATEMYADELKLSVGCA